jgi:hypothetical protein
LFASVQTLARNAHLGRFETRAFDYIVVNEFHHAAATTYRRIIDHFQPGFSPSASVHHAHLSQEGTLIRCRNFKDRRTAALTAWRQLCAT